MHFAKPPIVLLRGLLREQRHWGAFIADLKQFFDDREIICLDIPGNGKRNHEKSPVTIQGMRIAISEQLNDLLGPEQAIELISISMGGMIALDWANAEPQRIKSVVLINSSLKQFSPFYHRLNWQTYPAIIKILLIGVFNTQYKERQILRLTSNKTLHLPPHARAPFINECVTIWSHFSLDKPVSLRNAFRQLLAAATFAVSHRPSAKILVVKSKWDYLVNSQCSEQLAKNWQLEMIEHPWAGHDLPLDDPIWLCRHISQFIDKST
ncbi:alpha/beta hydrolase [Saccharobesus litoralis]|uniref:Alpha/beta hydrolase n=1 Tax=Saccharobesus litoralis TaxID=2172099 RepID=A0A2S0VUG2_9ALTE|nr:alpha/beta hydrolase [Saccharobesus litoralis]AWB67823.1 alpha/beta hydrolase [Saccharobesus litoralis]